MYLDMNLMGCLCTEKVNVNFQHKHCFHSNPVSYAVQIPAIHFLLKWANKGNSNKQKCENKHFNLCTKKEEKSIWKQQQLKNWFGELFCLKEVKKKDKKEGLKLFLIFFKQRWRWRFYTYWKKKRKRYSLEEKVYLRIDLENEEKLSFIEFPWQFILTGFIYWGIKL